MSIITDLTRMWLTRSRRPFTFTNEYDGSLPFGDCGELGLYVHIPFCRSLCGFCPYCKQLFDQEQCRRYVDALLREIALVGGQNGERKTVTSLYFGGGTPALAADRLGEIVQALGRHFEITEGVGLELHPDDVRPELLAQLRAAGVSKLSIGVQSFQPHMLKLLGRRPPDGAALGAALSEAGRRFDTVSMDFIFALPGQTLADLQADIEQAQDLGANHIAVYPFIDFAFTPSRVRPLSKRQKRRLLDALTDYCLRRGWRRTSIWTFARPGAGGYSSMTRSNYLGFGCSAVTLLREQFKINTFSVPEYCRRLEEDSLPTSLTLRFTPRQRMLYYLFWTAYGMEVSGADFQQFFGVPLKKIYGGELALAKMLGLLTEEKDGLYRLTGKGAFYYHYYENFYTLAYIDKMWGILKEQPWPERLEL